MKSTRHPYLSDQSLGLKVPAWLAAESPRARPALKKMRPSMNPNRRLKTMPSELKPKSGRSKKPMNHQKLLSTLQSNLNLLLSQYLPSSMRYPLSGSLLMRLK
jgi:hypothetical protein